jgi:hypothetical protein
MSKTKTTLLVTGLLAFICSMGVVGAVIVLDTPTDTKAEETPAAVLDLDSTPADLPVATASAPKPAAGITDEGILAVGTDVKPGTYRTTVPEDSFGCYWARLRDLNGGLNSIIANGNAEPGAKVIITIKSTDKYVQLDRCGNWTKV